MEMINRCLEVSPTKRAEIERADQQDVDRRHSERKAMIAARRERRVRQGEEIA